MHLRCRTTIPLLAGFWLLSTLQVVQRLFSEEWETGTFEGMKTITETYADYFGDLHGWLLEYFFAKLARACFEKSVKVL